MLNMERRARATLKRLDNSVGPVTGIVEQPRLGLTHATGRPRRPCGHPLDGPLDFLGLRSRGPTAVSASSISRFCLRLGGSSARRVVASASVGSTSITLASPPTL